MSTGKFSSEKGQTLVLVVIGFLVFVAILALVLDGGNAYAAKRAAQNAADAGALAGAQYLCAHRNEVGVIDAAIAKAQEYANRNDPDVSAVNVTIDEPNVTVSVDATVTRDTFFAGAIGFNTVSPRAEAAAACMAPGVSTLPVAWSCRENVTGFITCTENIGPCRTASDPTGMNCTYVVMDSVKTKKGSCTEDPLDPGYCQNDLVCADQLGTPPSCYPDYDFNDDGVEDPHETVIDCDINNDCVDDLAAGGSRSWLDLDGAPSGGAGELKGWIEGNPVDPIDTHTWLAGQSGVATSIFNTAKQYILGKDVILPVFNKNCNGYPTVSDPETFDYCNAGSDDHMDLIAGVGAGTYTYHIISFSAFHVTCIQTGKNNADWETNYQLPSTPPHKTCYGHDRAVAAGSIDENDKTIEGYFVRLNLGGYGTPGEFYDTGTFTVGLIK